MSTAPDTPPTGSTQDRARAEDNSLRNFFLPFLVASVVIIVIMAVIEQTAG